MDYFLTKEYTKLLNIMKLLDCVLIGLVCFIIVYILMREMNKRHEPFKSETERVLAQVQAGGSGSKV